MQQQTQENQYFVIYKYFINIVNYIMNNIEEFAEIYLKHKKIVDNENMGWLAAINQDDIPGPYDDLDDEQWGYNYSYDGYNGYDN